jgi:hypothetical protein
MISTDRPTAATIIEEHDEWFSSIRVITMKGHCASSDRDCGVDDAEKVVRPKVCSVNEIVGRLVVAETDPDLGDGKRITDSCHVVNALISLVHENEITAYEGQRGTSPLHGNMYGVGYWVKTVGTVGSGDV